MSWLKHRLKLKEKLPKQSKTSFVVTESGLSFHKYFKSEGIGVASRELYSVYKWYLHLFIQHWKRL